MAKPFLILFDNSNKVSKAVHCYWVNGEILKFKIFLYNM